MANIIGIIGNDTLLGTSSADTINGKPLNDTLTGGGGKDIFVYDLYDGIDTITDFGGVGKGTNPTAGVIAEVDTIKFQGFQGAGFTARNLLLTQNGANLEITFEGVAGTAGTKIILNNFKLENLDNLKASATRPAIGNIIFGGQTTITDSFNVLDANSTDTTIGIKNTVTFLNDLANNIIGLDDSNDVINGQGGDDKIDGLSGDDLLRGGDGNDMLLGDTGDDSLDGGQGNDLLNGGEGRDILGGDEGNDKLFGGNGNDILFASSGNDTLVGGSGGDRLSVLPFSQDSLEANRLFNGDDGNDTLSAQGYPDERNGATYVTGNNTLNGGAGNDTLLAEYSTGNNLLSGGDGNDSFFVANGAKDTVDGGAGDDLLSYDSYKGITSTFKGITSTFNAITNSGSITLGTSQVIYKNIERLAIEASSYDDKIVGSNGDDTIGAGRGGNDTVDGGTGNDLLLASYYFATEGITTTFNATTNTGTITDGTRLVRYKNIERLNITGTDYNDSIVGNDGNDTLDAGRGGNDTVDGGTGNDLLLASYYFATEGITTTFNATTNTGTITDGTRLVRYKNIERLNITGTAYDDLIVGNNGNDTLASDGNRSGGNDTIIGGGGNDYLDAKYSNEYFSGFSGNNIFNGNGGTGDDTLDAQYSSNDNLLSGDEGNDSLFASGYSSEILEVYDGPIFSIYQTSGNNTLNGGAGNDTLNVDFSIGDNILNGGDGSDILIASGYDYDQVYNVYRRASGNNTLKGGAGSDSLIVDDSIGDNLLDGGDGNDILSASGATGKNTLRGGNGNDSLIGGSGIDTFVFNSFNEGVDKISDFNATNEVIQVSAAGFGGGLSAGVLKTSQLKIGTSATTNAQRFIYNSTTGGLFFDKDGSAGTFAQVQFGQLSTGLSLTNTNFVVV